MSDFSKFVIKAFLRKALTVLGTYLLAHGLISESESNGFVAAHLDELLGAVLLAGSAAWTFIYQRYVKEKVLTALALPQGATPAQLERHLEEKKEVG